MATAAASADGVMLTKLNPVVESALDPEAVLAVTAAMLLVLLVLAVTCCCGWSACRTRRGWNWGRVEAGVGEEEKVDVRGSKSDVC